MKGKLHISLDSNLERVVIVGNAQGLHYLSDVCLRLIGKEGPAAHFHLMVEMNNLEKGSTNTDIVFSEKVP
jgi:hypothetical protein